MRSHQQETQQAGTVGPNPVRLDKTKAEDMVEALAMDLAATMVLYHQLQKHRWTIAGAESHGLTDFFRVAVNETVAMADDIADRIRTLGGVPLSGPATFERHSPIPFEGADVYDARTALTNDLRAYGDLVEQVSSHIELAQSYGDHATADLLRRQLVVLEESTYTLDRFLASDSLTAW